MSEIRRDRIHNEYVLIAPERLRRPDLHAKIQRPKGLKSKCPFCEGNESLTPKELYAIRDNEPNKTGWKTRVIPNLYKAVQVELEDTSLRDGLFEYIPGVGAHEILIDSPCHDCDIQNLKAEAIENWLRSMIIRIEDLKKDRRLIYLSIFKNHGASAGSTQDHPHTQIIALPMTPQSEQNFLEQNMRYYRRHGRGKIEDIVYNEIEAKKRIIHNEGNFVAFCPFASAYPFEIMIAPKKNITSLQMCSRDDISILSECIKVVFRKLHMQLGNFEYNMYFALPPINSNFENESYIPYLEKNYRFIVRIIPKIYSLGGFEMSTNMAINPVSPEECTVLLNSKD